MDARRSVSYDESYMDATSNLKEQQSSLALSPSMPMVAKASPTASSSSGGSPPRSPVRTAPTTTTLPTTTTTTTTKESLVYRSHFSKVGGFSPPYSGNHYQPGGSPGHAHISSDDDSQPFDQREDPRPPPAVPRVPREDIAAPLPSQRTSSNMSRPFDEANDAASHYSRPFDESMDEIASQDVAAANTNSRSLTDWEQTPDRPSRGTQRSYHSDTNHDEERFRMPTPRSSEPRLYINDSLVSPPPTMRVPAPGNYEEFDIANGSVTNDSSSRLEEVGDDDSLFEFEEERRNKNRAKKWRNSRRARAAQASEGDVEEDDTSLEQDYGAVTVNTSLQERTQAAWKRKSSMHRREGSGGYNNNMGVSFGINDTVHTFEPDEADETADSYTLGGYSVNSEYTKSAESEVEDVIKDILLIGGGQHTNPGRRKIKYAPGYKEKQRQLEGSISEEEEEDEDDTLEEDEEEIDSPKKSSSSKSNKRSSPGKREQVEVADEKKEEDPLLEVWNFVEGGISAVSNALGLDGDKDSGDEKPKKTEKRSSRNLLDYASDAIGGSGSSDSNGDKKNADGDDLKPTPSLEEDVRLIDLALQAAHSAHKLRGYEFDESYEINIVDDIKFSVVDLELPLGIIFQENEGGCWVTKVLPNGSAAKTSGKSVAVGDQLAAIDGLSAIRMKVNEIAKAIKAKRGAVELTFLRYVGPMRPAVGEIEEEGYEVKASAKKDPPVTRMASKSRSLKKTTTVPSKASKMKDDANTSRRAQASTSASRKVSKTEPPSQEKKRFRLFGRKKKANQ